MSVQTPLFQRGSKTWPYRAVILIGILTVASTLALQTVPHQLKCSSKSAVLEASNLNDRGIAHVRSNEDRQAIPYFKNAIRTLDANNLHDRPRKFLSQVLNTNLAKAYYRLGDFDMAGTYYVKAMDELIPLFGESHPFVGSLHLQLSLLECDQKDYSSAGEHLELARQIFVRPRKGPVAPFIKQQLQLTLELREDIEKSPDNPALKLAVSRAKEILLAR